MPFNYRKARVEGWSDEDIKERFRKIMDVDRAIGDGWTMEEISSKIEFPKPTFEPPEPPPPVDYGEPKFETAPAVTTAVAPGASAEFQKTQEEQYGALDYVSDAFKAFVARPATGAAIGVTELLPEGEGKENVKGWLTQKYGEMTGDIETAAPKAEEWAIDVENHPVSRLAELGFIIYASGGADALRRAPDAIRSITSNLLYKQNKPVVTPEQARRIATAVRRPGVKLSAEEQKMAEAFKGLERGEVGQLVKRGGVVPGAEEVTPRFTMANIGQFISKFTGKLKPKPGAEKAPPAGAAKPPAVIEPTVAKPTPTPTAAPPPAKADVADIIDPLSIDRAKLAKVTDPESQKILQENIELKEDTVIPGIISMKPFDKSIKKMEERNIAGSVVEMDFENIKGLNEHHGGIHARANEDIRRIIGDIVRARFAENNGLVARTGPGSDEFHGLLVGKTPEEAEAFMVEIKKEILAKRKELGISDIMHARMGLPTGALDMYYGVSEFKPGKYGDMSRQADEAAGIMKDQKIDAIAKEKGYIWGDKENKYVKGEVPTEVKPPTKLEPTTGVKPSVPEGVQPTGEAVSPAGPPTEVKKPPAAEVKKVQKVPEQTLQKMADPDMARDKPELFQTPKFSSILEDETGAINLGKASENPSEASNIISGLLKENFRSSGHLPRNVFNAKIARDGWYNSEMRQVIFNIRDFKEATDKAYPKGLTDKDVFKIDEAAKSIIDIKELPKEIQGPVSILRQHVDALTQKLIDVGAVEGELALVFDKHKGVYMKRTYRVFKDPKWAKNVPEDVRNRAKAWVRDQYKEDYMEIDEKIRGLERDADDLGGRWASEYKNPDRQELITDKIKEADKKIQGLKKERDESAKILQDPGFVDGKINELLFEKTGEKGIIHNMSKLGKKDLSILKKRKDIPPELRALWGEEKDPLVTYVETVSSQAQLVANHQFLTEVKKWGLGKIFYEKPYKEFASKLSAESNKSMAPLNGLYTTPEMKKAFEGEAVEKDVIPFYKYLMRTIGWAKYAKTVGSVQTHVRNLTGNTSFAVIHGHWNVPKAFPAAAGILENIGMARPMINALNRFGIPITMSKETQTSIRERIRRLTELGVLGEGARAGEIMDVMKDAKISNLETLLGSRTNKFLKNSKVKTLDVLSTLYMAEDDIAKWYFFENEFARYRKRLPVSEFTDKQIEERVAGFLRNTTVTYSMVPKGIKAIRRFPFVGTFVSFPWEIARTSIGTINLIREELKDDRLKDLAYTRMIGAILSAALITGASITSKMLFGVSDEEEDAMRRMMPPWSKNRQLVHFPKMGKGQFRYIDMGYVDPHSYLKEPILALIRGEDAREKIIESVWTAFEPFLSKDMYTERMIAAASNKKPSGAPIRNKTDKIELQALDTFNYMAAGIEPGTITSIRRVWKGITKEPVNNYGKTYDPRIEGAAMFTGQRISQIDAKQSFWFKSGTFSKDLINAGFTLRNKPEARVRYNINKLLKSMHRDLYAALTLGVDPQELKRTLEARRIDSKQVKLLFSSDFDKNVSGVVDEIIEKRKRGIQKQKEKWAK